MSAPGPDMATTTHTPDGPLVVRRHLLLVPEAGTSEIDDAWGATDAAVDAFARGTIDLVDRYVTDALQQCPWHALMLRHRGWAEQWLASSPAGRQRHNREGRRPSATREPPC